MGYLPKTIAVANQKGGVGKTTTAINLSAALAKRRKRVLLVDSDPQGNCSSGVGVPTKKIKKQLYHLYCGEISALDVVVPTRSKFLDVLPSSIDLVAAELELVNLEKREGRLKVILEALPPSYDYIIIAIKWICIRFN